MSGVVYEPWTSVVNLKVQLLVDEQPATVFLPWVAAPHEQALTTTALIVSELTVRGFKQKVGAEVERRTTEIEEIKIDGHEPGLHKFQCPECGDDWDAWVDDSGRLEDPRDICCGTKGCKRFGHPARMVE